MNAPILPIRSPAAIAQAAKVIRAGELVIIPTDTIYGIATLPQDPATLMRLYAVRDRAPEPALPFLLAESDVMATLARVNPTARRLARQFWPGSLTLILPPGPNLIPINKTLPVALRVPNFPLLHTLLTAVGGSLFTSGAIRSGYPPAITAQEAASFFGDQVALILDGGHAPYGVPSTIVDCVATPPAIVRRGAIPEHKIWQTLGIAPPTA